ncbi:MAG: alpha/beta hydrolase [Cyanobacteria bacterium J06635_13]
MPNWDVAIADFSRSGGYYGLANRIPLISQASLILWGDCDEMLGTAAAVEFEQAIADSRLIWLPGVGHTPHWEQPKIVARHILNFIDS